MHLQVDKQIDVTEAFKAFTTTVPAGVMAEQPNH